MEHYLSGFQINGYVKLNDLKFTPEMTDPSNREFQVLARNLEIGISKEFCNGLDCRTNIVVFQQGKTNIRKNNRDICNFPPDTSPIIVYFTISMCVKCNSAIALCT